MQLYQPAERSPVNLTSDVAKKTISSPLSENSVKRLFKAYTETVISESVSFTVLSSVEEVKKL